MKIVYTKYVIRFKSGMYFKNFTTATSDKNDAWDFNKEAGATRQAIANGYVDFTVEPVEKVHDNMPEGYKPSNSVAWRIEE